MNAVNRDIIFWRDAPQGTAFAAGVVERGGLAT
jgi:hypothetical protein